MKTSCLQRETPNGLPTFVSGAAARRMPLAVGWLVPVLFGLTGACSATPEWTLRTDSTDSGVVFDSGAVADAGRLPGSLLIPESLQGDDVPARRVGVIYRVNQANAVFEGGDSIEEFLRAQAPVPQRASGDYLQTKPLGGVRCLYQPAPSDTNPEPTCPDIEKTLEEEAKDILAAGIDFVVVSPHPNPALSVGFSPEELLLQVRPAEVLVRGWANLRRRGIRTPQVAIWARLPAGSTQYTAYKALYDDPANADLLMHDKKTSNLVFFVSDADPSIVAEVGKAAGARVSVQSMDADNGWKSESPCIAGNRPTTDVLPACNQKGGSGPLGDMMPVAPTYAVPFRGLEGIFSLDASRPHAFASLPFGASGRRGGLTYMRQWETALASPHDYVLINAWNANVASGLRSIKGWQSMGLTRSDPVFMDGYGHEFSRTIEPDRTTGRQYQVATASCVELLKGGGTCQSAPTSTCCAPNGSAWNAISSLRAASGDNVLSTNSVEKQSLTSNGWTEVCARTGTSQHFCAAIGDIGDGTNARGPFFLYSQPGANRVALRRCAFTTVEPLGFHFAIIDRPTESKCRDQKDEGVLGYLSTKPTSETPRRVTRCFRADSGERFLALDGLCPAPAYEVTGDGVLGWAR